MQVSPSVDPHPYERSLLATNTGSEILIMTWRADARCAPHDHGTASGAIHIIEGRFEERRYQLGLSGLVVVSTQVVQAPAIIQAPAGVIHDMCALGGRGVSVHRYTPEITQMRVYDVDKQQVLIVADDCGAWVPGPGESHQLLAVEAWPSGESRPLEAPKASS